jgi:hypothetical protein
MRIRVGLNLDMPLDWRIRFLPQDELSLRSILLFFGSGKYPFPGAFGLKVFLLNPSSAFIRVPSHRPSP